MEDGSENSPLLSVVIPAYNEAEGLRALYQRLTTCAMSWNEAYEVVLVDDGSCDDTLVIAQALADQDARFKIVSLARNFGHQPAVTAGLDHARGDLVAIMDADLQDPPEQLGRFFQKCREGYDIVYGIRKKRAEGLFLRLCYRLFYRILARLVNIDMPLDSGDFCVMNRRAIEALKQLPEHNRYIRGLRAWIGFRQIGLPYERQARVTGTSKYTLMRLINLGLDGIVNFSSQPLRLISVLGVLMMMGSGLIALWVGVQYTADLTVLGYNPRHAFGWTLLLLCLWFGISMQCLCLGILAEYIGRLFDEIKHRPTYIVDRTINFEPSTLKVNQKGCSDLYE